MFPMEHRLPLNGIVYSFGKIVLNLLDNLQCLHSALMAPSKHFLHPLPPAPTPVFFINLVLSLEEGAPGSVQEVSFLCGNVLVKSGSTIFDFIMTTHGSH